MVYFPNANVIMTGDYYRSLGYPNIDRANGGTLKGMLEAFETTINRANATTKIVPGHGTVVDKTAVAAHRDMVIALRDKVAALVKQGKTQEEVLAAKLTAGVRREGPAARHDRRPLHHAALSGALGQIDGQDVRATETRRHGEETNKTPQRNESSRSLCA